MQNQILDLLKNSDYLRVTEITEQLGMSAATVRRHLKRLQQQGLVQRTHGGVRRIIPTQPELPFTLRAAINKAEKEAIGRTAAKLVQDGESVFIGSGSTTLYVAQNLIGRKGITVMTNSLTVVNALAHEEDIELICPGGLLRHSEASFIGFLTESALQVLRPKKVIIGIGAISLTDGLTNDYFPEVSTDRIIVRCAPEVILVADHTKFDKLSTTVVAPITAIHKVVTDCGTSGEILDELKYLGIEVVIAS
jgi:DeoR family transcriptional regulator of aga operon/DeoR family fructose operon transcriptional repressor